ncbi:MAG: TlpA family protein disulfide reductase [Calditrichaeota bacterium]|nr:TlpA family protein disulfide reductase [Calditrichota bacterium]
MRQFRLVLPILLLVFCSTYSMAADKAADFTIKGLDNTPYKLSELLKKGPVLVDFWATWCKPCCEELPALEKIHRTYAEKGLRVIAISVDDTKSRSKVKPFIKGSGWTFAVMLDENMEARKKFGGTVVPFTALIAQNGEIVYCQTGYVRGDEKELEAAVAKFMSMQTSAAPDAESKPVDESPPADE